MKRRTLPSLRRQQRGVATLIVVMVLFFVISLVAAYTNRNLIFEQRTSANQYRSTQALEAAEAGIEWALALLNHGRITATCTDSASTADTSFRDRYVNIDPATGKFTARPWTSDATRELMPSCVFNGTTWDCSCPDDSDPTLTPPVGTEVYPAFRVRFRRIAAITSATDPSPRQPGVMWIDAVGCTRLDNNCLAFAGAGQGVTNEGRVLVSTMVGLTGNAASLPLATVTARRNITPGGAVVVYNTGAADSGITVQAGGNCTGCAGLVLRSSPGTPAAQSVIQNDAALALAAVAPFSADDRMFAALFNMWPDSFRDQPAAVRLTCGGGGCTAANVRDAISLNPKRPIWVAGDLDIDTGGDIGSATDPTLLVVEGDLTFSVSGVTIYGLTYVRTPTWNIAGTGQFQGAVVAQRDLALGGNSVIAYNADVLRILRGSTGSFVRIPGSWKDFQ